MEFYTTDRGRYSSVVTFELLAQQAWVRILTFSDEFSSAVLRRKKLLLRKK